MSPSQTLKRIALLGPESSGKTTLCRQLATHYRTRWVPEFARGYVSGLERSYTLEDILFCAEEQLRQEELIAAEASQFLFCDTEFILSKIWCLDVFKLCPPWILDKARMHRYDLYLLTAPDLPFKPDPLRENPHRRDELFEIYKKELQDYGFPFEVISGIGKKRFLQAVKLIDRLA